MHTFKKHWYRFHCICCKNRYLRNSKIIVCTKDTLKLIYLELADKSNIKKINLKIIVQHKLYQKHAVFCLIVKWGLLYIVFWPINYTTLASLSSVCLSDSSIEERCRGCWVVVCDVSLVWGIESSLWLDSDSELKPDMGDDCSERLVIGRLGRFCRDFCSHLLAITTELVVPEKDVCPTCTFLRSILWIVFDRLSIKAREYFFMPPFSPIVCVLCCSYRSRKSLGSLIVNEVADDLADRSLTRSTVNLEGLSEPGTDLMNILATLAVLLLSVFEDSADDSQLLSLMLAASLMKFSSWRIFSWLLFTSNWSKNPCLPLEYSTPSCLERDLQQYLNMRKVTARTITRVPNVTTVEIRGYCCTMSVDIVAIAVEFNEEFSSDSIVTSVNKFLHWKSSDL